MIAITQAVLSHLGRGKGRIVTIGSIAGRFALPGSGAYDATKFALEAITDALRVELHPFGIHVALIEPGAVATDIWGKSLRDLDALVQVSLPDHLRLYERLIAGMREEMATSAAKALPAEVVANRVVHTP